MRVIRPAVVAVAMFGLLSAASLVHAQAAAANAEFKPKQAVEVEWGGQWWAAEVMEVKEGKYYITYTGWGKTWDEWVGKERIRAVAKVLQRAEVEWGGTWWPAEVLETKGDKYYIHYTGWDKTWDEWVGKDRIRLQAKAPRMVEVEWGGKWWPAEVLQTKDGKYLISYTGWGKEWDEWVPRNRIRFAAAPPKKQ